jgi:hypothetical protein
MLEFIKIITVFYNIMAEIIKVIILFVALCIVIPFVIAATPLLVIASFISPKFRAAFEAFSKKYGNKKELEKDSENAIYNLSLTLHAIYDILDFEAQLYEMPPKVVIVFEDIEMLKSVMNEHELLKTNYAVEFMSTAAYIEHCKNRNASYSFYYFGNDISIKPPVGVLQSHYFYVDNAEVGNTDIEIAEAAPEPEPQTEIAETLANIETILLTTIETNEFVESLKEGDKVLFGSQEIMSDFFAKFGDIVKHGISFSVLGKDTDRDIAYDFFVSEKPYKPKKIKAKKHVRL